MSLLRERARLVVILAALSAAALSAAYVAFYLRGGPRIIDATSYFLEARALASGDLAFPIGEPATSVLGRFLVRTPDGAHASVIFPPGYPAVLALGFLVGHPMLVGPLLAFALVLATSRLARAVFPDKPELAPLAAVASVLCGALRYHTADTMSHGLAALCFAASLAFVLEAVEPGAPRPRLSIAFAGLAAGWLFATRPVTALALLATIAILLVTSRPSRGELARAVPLFALGASPGLGLFALHALAATGSLFGSAQRAYYAVSDGPPDCFRYGFGSGIGCVGEHGDFVAAHLRDGFGALAALGTTARRLKAHLVDAGNSEPMFFLVLWGARGALRERRARLLPAAALFVLVAYAPFYFDGNYPGGGARFFADVLPIEHVLLAFATLELMTKLGRPSLALVALAAAMTLGFALRTERDHAALRDREGGRPMYEAAVARDAEHERALVFFDTDHGFDLAFDPRSTALSAVREKGDALDVLAWETRGRPRAFRYRYDFDTGAARLEPFDVASVDASRIEGESLWPPSAQRSGFALPRWAAGTCVSAGRFLALEGDADVQVELPARALRGHTIAPGAFSDGPVQAAVVVEIDGKKAASWTLEAPGCARLGALHIPEAAQRVELRLTRNAGKAGVGLDRIEIDPR